MIKEFKIFESKQIGVLYHFTTLSSLFDMILRARYVTSEENKIFLKFGYKTNISLSRNFNMKSSELKIEKQCVRIVINGDKLSNHYKIEPFSDPIYDKTRSEREERIMRGRRDDVADITNYIIQIDVLKNPVLADLYPWKPINSYTFSDPKNTQLKISVSETDEIIRLYEMYLKETLRFFGFCKFNFKINVVDKMNPVRL